MRGKPWATALLAAMTLAACHGGGVRGGRGSATPAGDALPFVRASAAPPDAASPSFDAARKAYREGAYQKASERFAAYRSDAAPDDPLADNALFGEGLALFDQGRYEEAAQRFSALLAQWPQAETAPAALINLAVCRYWTGDWAEAERLLKEAAKKTERPSELAYVAYYRAALAERQAAYHEAALRAIDAERLAEDEALVTLAREKVERLFHAFLSDRQLEGFAASFAGKWPAKAAWEELLVRYRRTGQEEKRANAARELATGFAPEERATGTLRMDENAHIRAPKVGVALPITGAGADAGRRMFQGAQLAANDYHELIGSLGVTMVMKETGGTPASAKEAVEGLASDPSTIAVLGPVSSAAFAAATATAHEMGTPMISPAARGEGLASASSRLFRTTFLTSFEAEKLAELAMDRMGLKRFAVLYEESERGRQMTAYLRAAVTRRGGTLVGVEPFAPDEVDFAGQIKALGGMSDEAMRKEILDLTAADKTMKVTAINAILARRYAGKPSAPMVESFDHLPLTLRNFRPGVRFRYEGVFVVGRAEKTGLVMGQLVFYNIRGLPRFVSSEANDGAFLKNGERFADGALMVDGFFAGSERPAVKDFVRHYRIAFREEPDRVAAQSYDATRLLMAAMARGVRSRKQMTDYLSGVADFPGITGNLTMTASGDVARTPFYLTIRDGRFFEFDPRTPPLPEGRP